MSGNAVNHASVQARAASWVPIGSGVVSSIHTKSSASSLVESVSVVAVPRGDAFVVRGQGAPVRVTWTSAGRPRERP